MLTGWKDICRETGFSRNTIKRLARDEGFPLDYVATKPCTSDELISEWLRSRVESRRAVQ